MPRRQISARPLANARLQAGDIVIVHLINPTDKLWGILGDLDVSGLVVRGIDVNSFEDWTRQIARGDAPDLGLATSFFPLFRVERLYLDERVGAVESYRERFEERVGCSVESFFELEGGDASGEAPS